MEKFSWVVPLLQKCFSLPCGWNVSVSGAEPLGQSTGFLSKIFRLKLLVSHAAVAPDASSRDRFILEAIPDSVVLKIFDPDQPFGNFDGEGIAMDEFLTHAHGIECQVYEYLSMYDANEIGIKLPKFYGSIVNASLEYRPCLVLEDISQGTGIQVTTDGLTSEQLRSIIETLAKFHCFCYAHAEELRHLGFGLKFNQSLPSLRRALHAVPDAVRKDFPEIFTVDHIDIMNQLDTDELLHLEFNVNPKAESSAERPTYVLCHGDLWTHNVLFRNHPISGRPGSDVAAILDWQFACLSTPTQDIARLLATSVQTQLRQRETDALLAHYQSLMPRERQGTVQQGLLKRMFKQSFKVAALLNVLDLPSQISFARSLEHGGIEARAMVSRAVANLEDAVKL